MLVANTLDCYTQWSHGYLRYHAKILAFLFKSIKCPKLGVFINYANYRAGKFKKETFFIMVEVG